MDDSPRMPDWKFDALLWIARHLPWVWRHVVTDRTRRAWVRATTDEGR